MRTIQLQIRFLSSIKSIIGREYLIIESNSQSITIIELINRLKREIGDKFKDLVINKEKDSINPDILIFVDNKEIHSLQELNTPLFNGNQVVFLSSIHGGFKL